MKIPYSLQPENNPFLRKVIAMSDDLIYPDLQFSESLVLKCEQNNPASLDELPTLSGQPEAQIAAMNQHGTPQDAVDGGELIERVARAMWDVIPSYGDVTWDEAVNVLTDDEWRRTVANYRQLAKAAIAAMEEK